MRDYLECGTHAAFTTCTAPVVDSTTITTLISHSIASGDRISMLVPDRRWWMRLWHFVTFRSPPMLERYYTVTCVPSSTTATLSVDYLTL